MGSSDNMRMGKTEHPVVLVDSTLRLCHRLGILVGALVNIGSKYASILEVFNINQRDSADNNKIDKFQGKYARLTESMGYAIFKGE